jgi:hypothetical protein
VQTEGVTPAELKTTREALGLSSDWVAQVGGVAVRTVRHWEGGAARVPSDIAERLEDLARQVASHVASLLTATPPGPVTLLRYRDEATLRQATGLSWPVSTHAIAQLRVIAELRDRGMPARLIWFNSEEYRSWAAAQDRPTPQGWADTQPWDRTP